MALFSRARRRTEDAAEPHLIVGLGNPGPEYEGTRHNVGARAADVVASRLGERVRRSKHEALIAEARDGERRVIVARPTTYMNDSGRAVARVAAYYKIPAERIVVAHDDIDLPLARVRVKGGGGTAGHRGIESIVAVLGSRDFARIRIGVGRPPGRTEAADHVLREFSKRERELIEVAVEEAADAALAVVREGVEAAQNRFNAAPQA